MKNRGLEKTAEGKKMEFMKVISDEDSCKQAIFFLPEANEFYLYSYVNNDMANETMVFKCDENGQSNMQDIISASGYVPSSEMMERLTHAIS